MTKKKTLAIFLPVAIVVFVLILGCNIALGIFADTFDSMFGERIVHGGSSDAAVTKQEARDLTEELQGEGSVLLKNENSALPLQATAADSRPRAVVMGYDATDAYYGGSGSGSGSGSDIVTFLEGLTNAGIEYNEPMIEAIRNGTYVEGENRRGAISSRAWRSDYTIGEMRPGEYRAALTDEVKNFADTAVVVIGRSGGEGFELTDEMYDIGAGMARAHFGPESERGKHYLELSTYEYEMMKLARENFDKVVVVVNANNPMELGFVDELGLDACIWTGGTGSTGWNAVGRILTGDINPSGHLASTYVYDHTLNPTYYNFNPSFKNTLNLTGSDNWNAVVGYTADKSHHYSNRDTDLFTADNDAVFGQASTQVSKFVTYEEGIYVGYRYWETKYTNEAEYRSVVQYPFGYGMSYSDFEWSDVRWHMPSATDGDITVDVTVTNRGDYAGKDVVQLYYSAPYTAGGIEKSAIVLGDFAKTPMLYPAAEADAEHPSSATVTLTVPVDEMASYDYENFRSYVLEDGNYTLSLRTDVHTPKTGLADSSTVYNVGSDVVYNGADGNPTHAGDLQAAVNLFDDSMRDMTFNGMTELSRNGSMEQPKGVGETFNASPETLAELATTAKYDSSYAIDEDLLNKYENTPVTHSVDYPLSEFVNEHPGLGYYIDENNNLAVTEESGLSLPTKPADLGFAENTLYSAGDNTPFEVMNSIDRSDAETWNKFVSQMSLDEMVTLVMQGGYKNERINSIFKPRYWDVDGPSGLSSPMGFTSGSAVATNTYCVEAVVGCTWNVDLARQYGESIGKEANANGFNGWYAPGVNIHRNPFEGRTFEYFSEDPLLTGKIGAAMVRGARYYGVYAYVKHFAVNEQDTYRDGLNTWLSEQALREIYLKPFEICVKEGHALGIMSSFNRIGSTWAGASYELLTEVLRNEWGFEGAVVTDYYRSAYMSMRHGVFAGNDLALQGMVGNNPAPHVTVERLQADNRMQQATYNACKNILYMTTRGELADISLAFPVWRVLWIVGNIVLGLGLIACVAVIVLKVRKKN